MRRARATILVATLVLLLLLASGPTPDARAEKTANFAQKALDWVEVADPIVTDKITLFPLVVPQALGDIGVEPAVTAKHLGFVEPDFPRHRYDVEVKNQGSEPVLVIGGLILEGGKRDRLIRQSAIIGAESSAEIRCFPASTTQEKREEAEPFTVAESLAPLYLRKKAEYGGSAGSVTTFIARWLDLRDPGDERKSLVAIATAEKLKSFCLPCHEAAARFPMNDESAQRVIGGVGVIRGRVQGLFLYGNNALVRAYFPMMLRGATYPAAAIEIRAEKAGIPLPGEDDPDKTLAIATKAVTELLARLRKARYRNDDVGKGQLGEALLLDLGGGTRGRAVGLDGRLVQLVVYPHDPFQTALYGSALDVPDADTLSDPERPGLSELERRARDGGRLSEAEQRLLDRLRPLGPMEGGSRPQLPQTGPQVPESRPQQPGAGSRLPR